MSVSLILKEKEIKVQIHDCQFELEYYLIRILKFVKV